MIFSLTRAMICRSMLTNSSKIIQCRPVAFALKYSTGLPIDENKPMRASLRLRRQQLSPYPDIELVRKLELNTFVKSNFEIVKYGDHEFKQSLDGYVHVYVSASEERRHGKALLAYSVYYGWDHPLNDAGLVEGRNNLRAAYLFMILRAMKSIPKSTFTNVCLCVPDISLIKFVGRSLRYISENSFRSIRTGKLNKDLPVAMALNTELRERNDLKLRMKFVPKDIAVADMYHCHRIAERTAMAGFKATTLINDDEEGFYD